MGFFKFYDEKFDPKARFINVSFQGKTFPTRSKSNITSFFDKDYISKSKDDLSDSYFLIRDPFNNTYNPGKTFKLSYPNQVDRIKQAIKDAKENLYSGKGL